MQEFTDNVGYELRRIYPESEPVNMDKLGLFQKILLSMDGTLTQILEILISESIRIVKLFENCKCSAEAIPVLAIDSGKQIMERKVVLQGITSGKNLLYAESIIVPHRLEEKVRNELIKSKTPIGKLWQNSKIETFKEIVATFQQPAGILSNYFDIAQDVFLLCRTYLVYSKQKPIMMITEKFPKSYYVKP